MSEDEKFQAFYAQEAAVYEQTRYETGYGRLFRKLHHHILNTALATVDKKARCLEVACGTGHTTQVLVEHFEKITACDLTPEMMSKNRFGKSPDQVTYLQANAFALPFPDNSFDVLISTRFLHLFEWPDQQRLFQEFHRVLAPGGKLIIDFDNIIARWLYVIPHVLYNLVRYQRLAPFSIYNFSGKTARAIEATGFDSPNIEGIAGWHLVLLTKFSSAFAFRAGLWHRRPLRFLAEQFMVVSTKPRT